MPSKWFRCPDGGKILISDCLKECGCRMGERCATRSYLRLVSRERPWTGKPSTTQLIRGTREAFLLLTKDYTISPDDRAFMAMGTKTHGNLEGSEDELSLLEQRFDGDTVEVTGISDVVELEGNDITLSDYKNSGSYKVAKALGFKVIEKETDQVFKSGKRKGQKKTIKELVRNKDFEDRWEWELQLNKYRVEFNKKFGANINKLKIQCVVRDGNTFIARSRGVFRNIYYFSVGIMKDSDVETFFKTKKDMLTYALEHNKIPLVCSGKENWDGLKCARYCSVAEFCSYGRYLLQNKQNEEQMIKGISEVRRLPRLGKLRLGIKKKIAQGKEYPVEIDYFRIDPATPSELENKKIAEQFTNLYGKEPKQIKIMFPVADGNVFFPQFYKRYGNGVLKCKGDGFEAGCISEENAEGLKKIGDGELGGVTVECNGRDCPYYKQKKCSESAALSVLLPDLKGAGVWEIVTGSYHSIVNVNSCIDYIRALCGRVHMIPLTLERREQCIIYDGKKTKHYILHVNIAVSISELQRMALIDPTRMMVDLPKVEEDKEDILFLENKVVNNKEEEGVLIINDSQYEDVVGLLRKNSAITKGAFSRYLKERYNCDGVDEIPVKNLKEITDDITINTTAILLYK